MSRFVPSSLQHVHSAYGDPSAWGAIALDNKKKKKKSKKAQNRKQGKKKGAVPKKTTERVQAMTRRVATLQGKARAASGFKPSSASRGAAASDTAMVEETTSDFQPSADAASSPEAESEASSGTSYTIPLAIGGVLLLGVGGYFLSKKMKKKTPAVSPSL